MASLRFASLFSSNQCEARIKALTSLSVVVGFCCANFWVKPNTLSAPFSQMASEVITDTPKPFLTAFLFYGSPTL